MPRAPEVHGHDAVSPWVRRWSHLVPAGATVLDLACGGGRHARWFAGRGHPVTAVDRDAAAVGTLPAGIDGLVADLEAGPWPLAGRGFGAVVVTNYLWRDRLPALLACVGAGGVLIYETFAAGNAAYGKPSNPAFLLQPGELLRVAAGLRVVAYEDGLEPAGAGATARVVQRIAALRESPPTGSGGPPPRLLPEGVGTRVKSSDSEEPA